MNIRKILSLWNILYMIPLAIFVFGAYMIFSFDSDDVSDYEFHNLDQYIYVMNEERFDSDVLLVVLDKSRFSLFYKISEEDKIAGSIYGVCPVKPLIKETYLNVFPNTRLDRYGIGHSQFLYLKNKWYMRKNFLFTVPKEQAKAYIKSCMPTLLEASVEAKKEKKKTIKIMNEWRKNNEHL